MKYDGDAVEELSATYAGDLNVSIGEYIEKGIGVCRHQGLLAAYIVEKMISDGKLAGKAKVERNTIQEFGGSHAWATFEAEDGTEYVIDAAQNFVGKKQDARKIARAWDYYLPIS